MKFTDLKKSSIKSATLNFDVDLRALSKSILSWLLRWIHVLIHEFIIEGLNFRAKALVYTTLLTMVPFLAVSFSVLKSFGAHNQLKPFLLEMLSPLGGQGVELGNNIVEFVENIQVGVLGSVGTLVLIYSVISSLEIIKDSFNKIWRTGETRLWLRRVSDYLSILLMGPLLIFSALGVMASMADSDIARKIIGFEPFGTIFYLSGIIIPYILIFMAFTFVYMFMPSTPVKFGSAFCGAVVAGLAWKVVGWLFAVFVVESASYNAIYSGFAIVILFMFWLYVSWVVLLLGGVISFYHQHPSYLLYSGKRPVLSHRQQEDLGFLLMYLIGKSYYEGKKAWTLHNLSDAVSLPWETVWETLRKLEYKGLLVGLNSRQKSFLPSRSLETIGLQEIYQALRGERDRQLITAINVDNSEKVQTLTHNLEQSSYSVLNGFSLRDLILGDTLKGLTRIE